MRITAEMSLYPLADNFLDDIQAFIRRLNDEAGLEVVTNQMSTQVRGDYEAVTGAIARCMREVMQAGGTNVLVVKYVNADLAISQRSSGPA